MRTNFEQAIAEYVLSIFFYFIIDYIVRKWNHVGTVQTKESENQIIIPVKFITNTDS